VKPPSPASLTPTRESSALPDETVGAEPSPLPATRLVLATRTSSGLDRRSLGYERSSSLTVRLGAVDDRSRAPESAWTTISFQPIRPGNVSSL